MAQNTGYLGQKSRQAWRDLAHGGRAQVAGRVDQSRSASASVRRLNKARQARSAGDGLSSAPKTLPAGYEGFPRRHRRYHWSFEHLVFFAAPFMQKKISLMLKALMKSVFHVRFVILKVIDFSSGQARSRSSLAPAAELIGFRRPAAGPAEGMRLPDPPATKRIDNERR